MYNAKMGFNLSYWGQGVRKCGLLRIVTYKAAVAVATGRDYQVTVARACQLC
jgi:hypothetical protein